LSAPMITSASAVRASGVMSPSKMVKQIIFTVKDASDGLERHE